MWYVVMKMANYVHFIMCVATMPLFSPLEVEKDLALYALIM